MSKKKSALIFVAGAVAGYKIAQRATGEAQDTSYAPFVPAEPQQTPYTPWVSAEPVSAPAPTAAPGTDPFRGAFREALAEVNLYGAAEDDTEVA
jgi:hypothetical protein